MPAPPTASISTVSPSERCRKSTEPDNELIDVDRLGIERLTTREGEQPAGQRRRALRTAYRIGEVALEISSLGHLASVALRRFDVAQHDHQEIVEVVGDAAGQLADRLHLLRLRQLLAASRAAPAAPRAAR